jgi:hypothetical protein
MMVVRARTKKRKMHDSYVFDDYMMEPWEEPDEAGYSEEEARRDLVEKEIRRRIKRDSKKRRRERFHAGALSRGSIYCFSQLTVEWAFMQNKLTNVLADADRLEMESLNESDGGEECEAILTAIRRAKRREARRSTKLLESNLEEQVPVENDAEKATTGGTTLQNLQLSLNGH